MVDTAGAQGSEAKTKVFISYSRKDMAFADKLEGALKARGFEVLLDREEIYAFEDWWKRLQALIGGADTIVFALSPDSVASREALREVDYAASLNKRFAPIVCRRVENEAVPEALRRLNFIFFDEADRFEDCANKLADALQTDIVWIRDHTKFGEAARGWVMAGRPNGLLLRTPALEMAEYWMASRPPGAPEPSEETRALVTASCQGARTAQRMRRVAEISIFTLMMAVILGLVGWINQELLIAQWRWYTIERPFVAANIWPHVLNAAAEQALKSNDTFRECASALGADYCPEMVVVPAGSFEMGAPATESQAPGYKDEIPQHKVAIGKAFAVSKFELTFAEWDTCAHFGDCDSTISDGGFGRGHQPVINVSWDDAKRYASWLSQTTGKTYRLLSEAEYEYAARAGTTTAYPWGDEIGKNNANCKGCGSRWDGRQTAPVGSFAPNRFGLFDMVGNVWEWTGDCHSQNQDYNYNGAPMDGSVWIQAGNCNSRMTRGGAWGDSAANVRSAARLLGPTGGFRFISLGFRVARTLETPN